MKRENKILLHSLISAIVLISIFIILNSQPVHAVDENIPGMPFGLTQETIEKTPQTPEEAQNITMTWLKNGWNEYIAKQPVIGKAHNYFLNHQLIFKILFNEPYSFSLTFIAIFALWLFLMILISGLVDGALVKSNGLNFLISIGAVMILAKIGFIKDTVIFTLNLILSPTQWWLRWLLGGVVMVILILITQLKIAAKEKIEMYEKEAEKEKTKQNAKEAYQKAEEAESEVEALEKPIKRALKSS